MARINIYVPDSLKARMDKRKDLNWSKFFQDCVEGMLEVEGKRDILRVGGRT